MRLYIAVLDEFPDYMVPTLVAHAILNAHMRYYSFHPAPNTIQMDYAIWLENSFKKCVVRVNRKEFDKICALPNAVTQFERHTLEGKDACVIVPPVPNEKLPSVLKYAKLWKPKE